MKLRDLLMVALISACVLLPFRAVRAGQQPASDDDMRIAAEALLEKMNKGEQVLILDVRTEGSYKRSQQRIKGDMRIGADEDLDVKLKDVPRDCQIVAYCT